MTVGDLKRIVEERKIPDDYIICMGYFDDSDYGYEPNAITKTNDDFYVDVDSDESRLVLETDLIVY
jgi:hypothetical protein